MTFALLVTILFAASAAFFVRSRKLERSDISDVAALRVTNQTSSLPAFTTEATQNVHAECMKLAFGVGRFDYLILGEHATVLEQVAGKLGDGPLDQSYLPRRPMLLPKLLQALQDDETTRKSLVSLILQDPALAGRVIQRANSAFYRPSPQAVENLDRAVSVLGTRGLRSLMPDIILQPVFRLPAGYFDKFAPTTWDVAQRAGLAAEYLARETKGCDPMVAQLLALIESLSCVILFRMTAEEYRELPEVLPRAEVFIRVLQDHAPVVATTIAQSWELLDPSIVACQEQVQKIAPANMSPLGRVLYFGQLVGSLAALVTQHRYSEEGAFALLKEQGLQLEVAHGAWKRATQLET